MPKTDARAARPRPLDIDTVWQLDRVGAPVLSPDGRHAVCAVTSYSMERNQGRSALWRLCTDGGAPLRLTTGGEKDGQPAWSPQGDRIAFLGRREQQGAKDDTAQLYVLPADGGEAERRSDFAPGIESFQWLPDGRGVVFAAWVWPDAKGAAAQARRHKAFKERKETGYATSEALYRYFDHHIPLGRVRHLLRLDLASGRVSDLFDGLPYELPRYGGTEEAYALHPAGTHIAFVHDPAPEKVLGNPLALVELDLATRRVKALIVDPAWDCAAPVYSPDGRRVAALAQHVGRVHTALAQPVVVMRGRRWQPPAEDVQRSADAPLRWSADGAALFYAAEDRGRCHLWRHDLTSGAATVEHAGGWVQGFDVAGGSLVVCADSALHPPRVFARRGGAGLRRIETFNDAVLRGVALGRVEEISVSGAQGDAVQMWLTYPPGFDARTRHAVNQVIHGGPFSAAGDTFSWRWNAHVLASRGTVVAQVNYHGSSGFGWAFRDAIMGRQGVLETQDIEAATDWLLAQRWCDPKRVVASGGSYGGFLVAWMNGHVAPGRYQAYVCHAGVFDRVATFSADSWPERPKDLHAKYWEDLPRVLAQSPMSAAAQMHTPTLVIHGAQDFRVPDCNGLAYYNTLKARGVLARLLWFPDENHWVLKPRNSRLWTTEFLDWIDRHTASRRKRRQNGGSIPGDSRP